MSETEKKAEQSTGEAEAPKPDAEHQRKINVANLPYDVTEKELRDLFTGHEVEKVEIYHYRKYTLALVLFKDKDTAAAALAEKEKATLRDRRLRMHMEFTTIRHIKREVIVTVVEDENTTEEQLWDKVKEAGVEPTSVLIFHPLGYVTCEKDCDKPALLEKLKAAGFNAHDLNQRDQNQHLDIWRAAKLFFRNRNRVQLLNIPNKWIEDKEEMKKQCAEGGTITEAVSNNVTQNPQVASNYARIFYETEEQAAKAAKALNGRVVEGKRIHALHLGSALMPNYQTSVYVTSLDKGVTEEQVYDHFKQFGEIDFTNRRNCGDAAIICFKNAASAEKALACTTFPAPTEEKKDATKEVTVKKYDGPIVLRPVALKRKLKTGDEEKDQEERTKEQQSVLGKLKAYYPIFVGNVPLNCPPLELKEYFAQHGPIKFMFSPQILAYRNSAPHPVKTFIIYYMNRPSQQNAVRYFDHKFFGGHRLHVLPLRGTQNMDIKKTVKLTKIPFMSEDALFKKIKPFVGKINRIVKKSRMAAYIELEDPADVTKMMDVETADHPLPKGKMEQLKTPVSARLYNEDDTRVLNGIAKIVAKNPDMLKRNAQPPNKRGRFDFEPGFDQGFNPNNNMNNPNAIQDLLRLAFMSGKNVGETLASNQNSFGPDPPVSNNFGDGGFGNRNRNNQGGNQGNFRGQGRANMNQNQNRGNNANNFGGNTNAGGNNFQNSPGNQNRGGQNINRGNNQQNQNRGGGNMNQGNNMNQGGNVNRQQQNKPNNMNTGNNQNQNRNNQLGGGNLNRNQNQNNRNNFDNDNSFGGGNNFGNNRNNNFSNDSFGNNDNNFGNNSGNFSSDNFGGNNSRGSNFGGNKRNQNDSFNSFGGGNNNSGTTGGNNRFNNDGSNFNSNFNNRNQNNRFDNDDNNFSGNKGGNNFGNRQNKPFNNNQGGNQGGGMSFGEFNNSNSNNRGGNFGGNNSGGFNSGNAGGNKWNNNSQQSNTGSRLAGSIFSRRF